MKLTLHPMRNAALPLLLAAGLAAGTASAQSPPDQWVTFHHDYQRTGRTAIIGPPNFKYLKWQKPVASGVGPSYGVVSSSPAIGADGAVYVSGRVSDEAVGSTTQLAAFTPEGQLINRVGLGTGQTDSSPSISGNGTVYIGSALTQFTNWGVQAWSNTLSPLWTSFGVFDKVLASPALSPDEKTVYAGAQDGIFYALNTTKLGESVWYSDQLIGPINSSAAVGPDGILYFGSQGDAGRINAVLPNGTLLWSFPVEGYVEGSPALSRSGILYFATLAQGGGGLVYAIDTKTVDPNADPVDTAFKWKNEDYRDSSFYSSVALGPDDTLYVGNTDGLLIAFDPQTGRRMWSFDVVKDAGDETGEIYSSPAVGGDGTVYFGADNGFLYAVDPSKSGAARLKAKIDLKTPVESSPAIGPDGTLYVGGMDGFLYAFGRALPGDVTGDGMITVADAVSLLQAVVNGGSTPEILSMGDVYPANPDGTYGDRSLDVADAVRLLRYLVGLEPNFPE